MGQVGNQNEHEKSSFISVGARDMNQMTLNALTSVNVSTMTHKVKKSYLDIEEFNTCATQRMKRHNLLSMNVTKLMRQKKKRPKVNPEAVAFYNPADQEIVEMGKE